MKPTNKLRWMRILSDKKEHKNILIVSDTKNDNSIFSHKWKLQQKWIIDKKEEWRDVLLKENNTLLLCPFCGSNELEMDCSMSQTTFEGPIDKPTAWHEWQYGYLWCKKCQACGPTVKVDLLADENLTEKVYSTWNTRILEIEK